ncbi:hypothetical protein AC1031_004519 [Aphanomyces cochlioides]|nr:hypothetical protein AC1031_004519 [Aphanomyces cochlioides]
MLNLFCAVVSKATPFSIKIDASLTVDDLKKCIKEEIHYAGRAHYLKLYLALTNDAWLSSAEAKTTTLDDLETLQDMDPTWGIDDFFKSDRPKRRIHVLVVVPDMNVVKSEAHVKTPHPKRKARWDQLNETLGSNKKKAKHSNSTGYSYVSWSDVRDVFETTQYTQPHKQIPDSLLNFLAEYLSYATKSMKPITVGNESQRLHVIAPILICVCFLFNDDVILEVEEDLNGDYVMAHGHFDFVLRRGDKKVCIVEAKRDDLAQGMAQDLLGCEVEAEIGHLDVVHGIVTNYVQWNFLRSLNGKIELEECGLDIGPNGPSLASLNKICGKIYSMLSDE